MTSLRSARRISGRRFSEGEKRRPEMRLALRRLDYDVKLPNFTFFEERGHKRGRGSNSMVKCWRCRITFAFVWRKNVDSLCTLGVK